MAPITDDIVEALRDTIHQLESRVYQLESKMGGGDGSSSSRVGKSSIRMILMGPPGAGKHSTAYGSLTFFSLLVNRQGHPSAKDSGQILRMSSSRHVRSSIIFKLIIWYRQQGTCFDRRSQRRRSWDGKPRKSWTRADLSATG